MYNQILIDNPDAALAEISECFSWCGIMTAEWQEVLLDVTMLLLSFVDEAADAVVAVLAADLVAAPAEVVKGITLLLLLFT